MSTVNWRNFISNGTQPTDVLWTAPSKVRKPSLFVGYQAQGSRGRALRGGAEQIRIHGQQVRVRARIEAIDGLSAHGDYHEILRWLSGFERAPKETFIVHGELEAALSLKTKIKQQLGWSVQVPEYRKSATLEV